MPVIFYWMEDKNGFSPRILLSGIFRMKVRKTDSFPI